MGLFDMAAFALDPRRYYLNHDRLPGENVAAPDLAPAGLKRRGAGPAARAWADGG